MCNEITYVTYKRLAAFKKKLYKPEVQLQPCIWDLLLFPKLDSNYTHLNYNYNFKLF